MDSDQTESNRRENAKALASACGSKAKFAERIDRSPGQVGHIIGKTPTKNIGKPLARHIEKCFDKPRGWLDIDHSTKEPDIIVGHLAAITPPTADSAKRKQAKSLIASLSQAQRRSVLKALSDQASAEDAAWAAALFADRVKRALSES